MLVYRIVEFFCPWITWIEKAELTNRLLHTPKLCRVGTLSDWACQVMSKLWLLFDRFLLCLAWDVLDLGCQTRLKQGLYSHPIGVCLKMFPKMLLFTRNIEWTSILMGFFWKHHETLVVMCRPSTLSAEAMISVASHGEGDRSGAMRKSDAHHSSIP